MPTTIFTGYTFVNYRVSLILTVTATPTQPTCLVVTGSIKINTPAPAIGLTYSIDGTTYTNTTGVFNGLAPKTYSVTVKNAGGCISTATTITINAPPSPPATPLQGQVY